MQRLYLLRHGHADRSAWQGADDQRPLTAAGHHALLQSLPMLRALGVAPEIILTSPLTRARQTACIMAELVATEQGVRVDERLTIGQGEAGYLSLLRDYGHCESVMWVGHEPDFSSIICRLIGGGEVVCKKGALARVDVLVEQGRGELLWLLQPTVLKATQA